MRVIIASVLSLLICASAMAQNQPQSPQTAPTQQHSPGYALQPGDAIDISVWQDPSLNRQTVIAPDGMISFPLIGQVKAGGKTIPVLEKEFSKRLSKNYKTPPQVTITLSALREGGGAQVFITGEVNRPGPYPITPGMSVMQAIAMSGGFGRFAAKSRIQIHRRVGGNEQMFLFDYSDFASGRNPASDIVLQAGDVIVVPERGLFF
jgi:polysaccharide export outer membrane protein